MSSSKSTVVGVRLDHDRRAWVEAEANRRGVTVRMLFEEFIDNARNREDTDASVPRPSRPWPCPDAARVVLSFASALARAAGGCLARASRERA